MRISDWSSDVCSSDLKAVRDEGRAHAVHDGVLAVDEGAVDVEDDEAVGKGQCHHWALSLSRRGRILKTIRKRFGPCAALPEAPPTAMPLLQRLALAALPAALLGLAACDRGPATVALYKIGRAHV